MGIEAVEKLIFSFNKGLLRGDILIDDHIKGRGQEKFKGKVIHFGNGDNRTWNSILIKL